MTLTRDWRSSVALLLAILLVLTAFVWGNQRHAQAATLAEQIICYVDWRLNQVDPNIPFDPQIDYCNSGTPTPPEPTPECIDGVDNDGDGKTDWGVPGDSDRDLGCDTPTDDDESNDPPPPAPQCSDGQDNDGDGLVDFPADPGCTSGTDTTEAPNPNGTGPQCSDGIDNDGDGLIDFPSDTGCTSADDNDETTSSTPAQCADGVDNDGDNLVDSADPGCADSQDNDETDEGQGGGGGSPQCSDGVDNDNDGQVDLNDPGCVDAQDDDETDPERNKGGSSRHGGGSSGSRGEVLGAQTGECVEYLTGYIRYGAQNDAEQVARLQVVLSQFEGAAINITGTYDAATLAAVNAFQSKYASEVLAPWNLQGPTGYVYYTTRKKINEVFCKNERVFPLTTGQLQEIEQVRGVNDSSFAAPSGAAPAMRPAPSAPAAQGATLPAIEVDENAIVTTPAPATLPEVATTSSEKGKSWWETFVNWLFGK